jgi:glutaredoxin
MLKDYLGEKSIEFTEKLVDMDDEARDKMVEESGGFMGVPFTVITKDDGSKEDVIGFDKKKLQEILGIS